MSEFRSPCIRCGGFPPPCPLEGDVPPQIAVLPGEVWRPSCKAAGPSMSWSCCAWNRRFAVTTLDATPLDQATPVNELPLSVRSYNCLRAAGLKTVGQVRAMTDEELLRNQNLGKRSLREIRELIGPAAWRCALTLTTDELAVLVACVGIAINRGPGRLPGPHEAMLARSPEVTNAVVEKLTDAMREAIGS